MKLLAISLITVAVLTGCGDSEGTLSTGGTSSPGGSSTSESTAPEGSTAPSTAGAGGMTADEVVAAVNQAGICSGNLGPYKMDQGEVDLEPRAVREMNCEVDDVTISLTEWSSPSEREQGVDALAALLCEYGLDGKFPVIASGPWVLSTLEDGMPSAEATDAILAELLGLDVSEIGCPD